MDLLRFSHIYCNAATREASGFLFIKHGKVFLVKRSQTSSEPGTWATIGGGVEEGEDFLKAAKRETKEEGGSLPEIDKIIGYKDFNRDNFTYRTFFATIKGNWKPELNFENDEYGWFDIKDLPEPLHPNMEKTFEKLNII